MALLGGSAVAWTRAAVGQPAGSMPTIGVLWPAASPPAPPRMESFRQALRQLGFVEGQNVSIELRYAQGGPQQLPALAAELVRLKVDVITTFGDFSRAWPSRPRRRFLSSQSATTYLAPASSPRSPNLGEIPPGSSSLPRNLAPKGWRCSKRWSPECREWLPFGAPQLAHHR